MSVSKPFENIIQKITGERGIQLSGITPLSGGDINDVFLLKTSSSEKIVAKINLAARYPGMFEAEKEGMEALAKPNVIDIPAIIGTGTIEDHSYLLLEYRESGSRSTNFWESFGQQMAALHQNTSDHFGFESDNYIGSLPQHNEKCDTASEFYITQRLEPQFKMARDRNYDLGDTEAFLKRVEELVPSEKPALIHGDLWNGNYLVNSGGLPCLIDPAVAYAPREMDLAMMKLFGGFNAKLFSSYQENFPTQPEFEDRIPLWQLYYLLVHLNLFGAGYLNSVTRIIKSFL